MKARWLSPVLVAVFLLACGGGGGGPSRPDGRSLPIEVGLGSLSGGVIRATLLFDGEELTSQDWSLGGNCAAGCILIGSTDARSGSHTVSIRIDEKLGHP